MFLYNKYQSTTPANVDSGKRTISWSHLSDPKVVWVTVKETDILRTAKDMAPPEATADGRPAPNPIRPQRKRMRKPSSRMQVLVTAAKQWSRRE